MAMKQSLLEMVNIERHYETPAGVVRALDGVSFEIIQGERVILLGPSGSGKTTLLNCLSSLDSPTGGDYIFKGSEVPRNHSEQMTSFRRENIGYVFQFFNLLQDLTVLENILLIQELSGNKDEKRAIELLKLVGLEDEINRFPGEISGGQQQRVAIARAIAMKPELILADEPTGNLDTENSIMISKILFQYVKEEGSSLIMVTHDPKLANKAKRKVRIKDGKIK